MVLFEYAVSFCLLGGKMKARNPVERIDKEPESSDVLESVQKGETPETVLQIPLDELYDFRDHPFRVEVNDEMMVDSDQQRENLLPSEKAFAY